MIFQDINTAPKDGTRIILTDGKRAADGIWHDQPFKNWYQYVWNDGQATQGLPFKPTLWTSMPGKTMPTSVFDLGILINRHIKQLDDCLGTPKDKYWAYAEVIQEYLTEMLQEADQQPTTPSGREGV